MRKTIGKRRSNVFHMIAVFAVCVLLATASKTYTARAEDNKEVEQNDTSENATKINLNTVYNGKCEKDSDIDFYQFQLNIS